jgi:hypothetical protein
MKVAAERIGMSTAWIRAQLTKGRLSKYKLGSGSHCKTLVDLNELQALIRKE